MRFIQDVALTYDGDDCLIWPFGRGGTGYASLNVDGRLTVASRYICRLAHGAPLDEANHAAHSCNAGDQGCVNPRHLSWKTIEENFADKNLFGTMARGPQMPHSSLTEDDVRAIRRAHPDKSMAKLAKAYGVCETTISNIIHRRKWAWVPD